MFRLNADRDAPALGRGIGVSRAELGTALSSNRSHRVASDSVGLRPTANIDAQRVCTTIAGVGGAVILLTLALRGVEVLPEAAFWPLLLFELGSLSMLFWAWMLAGWAVNEAL